MREIFLGIGFWRNFFAMGCRRFLLLLLLVLVLLLVATSVKVFWQHPLPLVDGVDSGSQAQPVTGEKAAGKDAGKAASENDASENDARLRILLKRGSSLREISQELAGRGAISSGYLFELVARVFGMAESLQAGEYLLPRRASLYDILILLRSGRTMRYSVTIPEGLTVLQIADLLRATQHLAGDVLSLPAEGYLLADTYYYRRGDKRSSIIMRMEKAMFVAMKEAWLGERSAVARKYLRTKKDILTLASLIERETGIASERGRVASVFYNRLEKGMKLQTDPSLIYWESGKRGVLGRGLRQSELRRDHPYNTYLHKGLPPTAIANPGRAAIAAALRPASSDDLYFVADGKGGHRFAKTFAEHLRNVRLWRGIESARKQRRAKESPQLSIPKE